MQWIAIPCGDGGHSDHQRLRCAVQRSSLRAQEVRQQGPRAHSGSKLSETPSTAGGFTAPVAAARGEYLATVRLGTPERVFSVIVDTGSDLTWVQCSPCGKCYAQNDSLFLPNNSTSFTKLACGSAQCNGLPYPMCNETTCVYWYSYGDGSLTTGDFVYDIITMDGINGQKQQVPNFAFGCGHDNEGSFAGHLSKWTLRYSAFGQNFEFSYLARLLKPIQNQKIHWRSVDGLANRGAVRFYPRGPTSCGVELTISYEVPDILASFASGVKPLVESILKSDLERFAKYAKSQSVNKNIPQKK